jgi:hypothetical protein
MLYLNESSLYRDADIIKLTLSDLRDVNQPFQAAQAAAAEEDAQMFKHKTVTTEVEDDDALVERQYKEYFPDHHDAFSDLAAMLEDPDATELHGDESRGGFISPVPSHRLSVSSATFSSPFHLLLPRTPHRISAIVESIWKLEKYSSCLWNHCEVV